MSSPLNKLRNPKIYLFIYFWAYQNARCSNDGLKANRESNSVKIKT